MQHASVHTMWYSYKHSFAFLQWNMQITTNLIWCKALLFYCFHPHLKKGMKKEPPFPAEVLSHVNIVFRGQY